MKLKSLEDCPMVKQERKITEECKFLRIAESHLNQRERVMTRIFISHTKFVGPDKPDAIY